LSAPGLRRPSAVGNLSLELLLSLYGEDEARPARVESGRLALRVGGREPVATEGMPQPVRATDWAPCGGGWRRIARTA
jgi:hypothetical protein